MADLTFIAKQARELSDKAGEISLSLYNAAARVNDHKDLTCDLKSKADDLRRWLFLGGAAILNPTITRVVTQDYEDFLHVTKTTLEHCGFYLDRMGNLRNAIYKDPSISRPVNNQREPFTWTTNLTKIQQADSEISLHISRLQLILLTINLLVRCFQPKKLVGTVIPKIEELTAAISSTTTAEKSCEKPGQPNIRLSVPLGRSAKFVVLRALGIVHKAHLAQTEHKSNSQDKSTGETPTEKPQTEPSQGGITERRLEKYFLKAAIRPGRFELPAEDILSPWDEISFGIDTRDDNDEDDIAAQIDVRSFDRDTPGGEIDFKLTESLLGTYVYLNTLEDFDDAQGFLDCAMRIAETLDVDRRGRLGLKNLHLECATKHLTISHECCDEVPPALAKAETALLKAFKDAENLDKSDFEALDLSRASLRLIIRHFTQFWEICDEGDPSVAELRLQRVIATIEKLQAESAKCTTMLLRAQVGLARAFMVKEQFTKSEQILLNLAVDKPGDDEDAIILGNALHLLAKVLALMQNFQDAKLACRRAIDARMRESGVKRDGYDQSVELMACICDTDGDTRSSAAYASLLPSDWDWVPIASFRQQLLSRKLTNASTLTLRGHEQGVAGVAYSSDGFTLATASLDGTVHVWDLLAGEIRFTFADYPEPVAIPAVAFSPSTKVIACARNHSIDVWDTETGTLRRRLEVSKSYEKDLILSSVVFVSSSKIAISRLWDSKISIWNVDVGYLDHAYEGGLKDVRGMTRSPSGQWLAYASIDGVVNILDATTGLIRSQARPVTGQSPYSLSFSPDSSLLAAIWNFSILVFDVWTGRQEFVLEGHYAPIETLAFSSTGRLMASGSEDGKIKVWDLSTRRVIHTLEEHTDGISALAFSPVGGMLVSCSYDSTVRLWDV